MRVARNGLLRRDRAPRENLEDTQDLAGQSAQPAAELEQTVPDPWPGGFWPAGADPTVAPRRWVRVSVWATLGLIVSLVALCATLTGLMAPEGFALGAVGVIASIFGLFGSSRPWVAGRSLAIIGLLAGLAATGLAVAAITGHLPWLDGRADAVPRWHAWILGHWPWLRRW
jgi:hypothetical protein